MGKPPRNALTFMPPAGATPHTFFIALCTIAVTLTLSLGACTPRSSHPTHESLSITSRTLKNIDDLDTPSTPTNGGTHVSTALNNNILTVASINSTEHTPQWALDISLTNASDSSISWPGDSDHDLAGRLSATTIGALVVSPNGNYISLALQVTRKQEEARLTDQSSTVELASQQHGYVPGPGRPSSPGVLRFYPGAGPHQRSPRRRDRSRLLSLWGGQGHHHRRPT